MLYRREFAIEGGLFSLYTCISFYCHFSLGFVLGFLIFQIILSLLTLWCYLGYKNFRVYLCKPMDVPWRLGSEAGVTIRDLHSGRKGRWWKVGLSVRVHTPEICRHSQDVPSRILRCPVYKKTSWESVVRFANFGQTSRHCGFIIIKYTSYISFIIWHGHISKTSSFVAWNSA